MQDFVHQQYFKVLRLVWEGLQVSATYSRYCERQKFVWRLACGILVGGFLKYFGDGVIPYGFVHART